MRFDDSLTDEIYEAAIVPEKWGAVLQRIGDAAESTGGLLFSANARYSTSVASPTMQPILEDFVRDGIAAINPRPQRAIEKQYPGFMGDHELFTEEEMSRDPAYQYLRKKGYGWCAGTIVQVPSGDLAVLSWERRFVDGPFSAEIIASLDTLRPHLARAALLSGRLGLEKARVAAETLGLIGLPCAVLSRSFRVLARNDLFEALVPNVIQDRQARITLANRRADRLLAQSIEQLGIQASGTIRSIPVAASDEQPASIIHVVPIRGAANDIFSLAAAIVVVTTVERAELATPEVIQGLFDLTPAEARVARGIVAGDSIDEFARKAGVSAGTVRQQLKSVFAKTGVSRQGELIGLLASGARTLGSSDQR
jgi:DNA-binding CsgD family transcriptional regulator